MQQAVNNLAPHCPAAKHKTMKPAARRSVICLAICAAWTLVLLGLWARGFAPLQQMEFFAQDWQTRLGRKAPRDDRLVLVGFGAGLTWASAVVQFGLAEKPANTGWLATPTRTVKLAQNRLSVAARSASMRASLMLVPLYTRVSRKQRPEEKNGEHSQAE